MVPGESAPPRPPTGCIRKSSHTLQAKRKGMCTRRSAARPSCPFSSVWCCHPAREQGGQGWGAGTAAPRCRGEGPAGLTQTTPDDQEALGAPKQPGRRPEKKGLGWKAQERLPAVTIRSSQCSPEVLSKHSFSSNANRLLTPDYKVILQQHVHSCSQVSHFEFN